MFDNCSQVTQTKIIFVTFEYFEKQQQFAHVKVKDEGFMLFIGKWTKIIFFQILKIYPKNI